MFPETFLNQVARQRAQVSVINSECSYIQKIYFYPHDFIDREIPRNKFYELILDCTAYTYQLLIAKGEVALVEYSGMSWFPR